jgi:hypothetical protein
MTSIIEDGKLKESLKETYTAVANPFYTIIIATSGNYTYIGRTGLGLSEFTGEPIWQIQRIEDGEPSLITMADESEWINTDDI